MARSESESMRKNNQTLNNLKFTARGLHKQWKVFYRSSYGKVGFYILLVYVVIALIAPAIAHGNPFAAVPSEDYFSPIVELNHPLSFTPVQSSYGITTSEYVTGGSYYMFMTGLNNGSYSVNAVSTKNASSVILFNIDGLPKALYSFSAYNYTTLKPQSELMVSTNNTIYTGEVICTYNPVSSTSNVTIRNINSIKTNSTILADFTSSKTYSLNPPSGLVGQFLTDSPSITSSYVYTFSLNSTGYFLNSYYSYNLKHVWSTKLTNKPTNLYFYGNEFITPESSRIIVLEGNVLDTYLYNGTISYSKTFNDSISNFVIPSAYQAIPSNSNTAFLTAGSYVYMVYINNGTSKMIYGAKFGILALGTSSGSSGFPGNFLLSSPKYIYALTVDKNGTLSISNTIQVPFTINDIKYYSSGTFLLSNTTDGNFIYLINSYLEYPFSWHASLGKITTSPVLFNNPWPLNKSLQDAPTIAVLDGNYLTAYSFEGHASPLPPTTHTLSGISLPLGTNTAGNNLWIMFIDSFPTDLEVGFAAGLITVLISVAVSMVIGYYSGLVSSFWETLSLAIFLIPGLPLFIVLATILGPTLDNLILIFSLLGWPFVTFSLIGVVRSIKSRTFIESAVVSNLSTTKILKRHILPNMGTLLAYLTSINIGGAVAAVSTYEILGLAPLTIPTWGGMLNGFLGDYYGISQYPWIFVPALSALTIFILAFIFISRGIDEVANPKLGGRK